MHILLIHQAFAAINEAGGTRHHELARILVQRGHRVTIIASTVSYLTGKSDSRTAWVEHTELEPGITLLRSYTYKAFHKSFLHRILSFISFMLSSFVVGLGVKQVDLVWGTSPPIFQAATAWLLARLKRATFLFEVRDLWPAFAIAIGVLKNPLVIRLSLWLEQFLYRHADCVMVNSPGFIHHVVKRGARWTEVVPNGADPEMFQPSGEEANFRTQHGLDGCFTVLYAGAHGLSNDLGIVLQAAEQLRDQPAIRFVLVGDGKEKAALQHWACEHKLVNTLFLPPVPKNQMDTVVAAADACIAILKPLDLYKTTYPNKVFDYMAAGRPVLLAIDGVIRQVVENAGAGIAVPPGDAVALANAVRQLAGDPVSARQMGADGQRYIQKYFDRRQQAEKLALLMEELRGIYGRKNSGR